MSLPPVTYDVISRNHGNCFSPSLCQNVSKGFVRTATEMIKNRLGIIQEESYGLNHCEDASSSFLVAHPSPIQLRGKSFTAALKQGRPSPSLNSG